METGWYPILMIIHEDKTVRAEEGVEGVKEYALSEVEATLDNVAMGAEGGGIDGYNIETEAVPLAEVIEEVKKETERIKETTKFLMERILNVYAGIGDNSKEQGFLHIAVGRILAKMLNPLIGVWNITAEDYSVPESMDGWWAVGAMVSDPLGEMIEIEGKKGD